MPYTAKQNAGIYSITNVIDDKRYIGSSVLLSRRKNSHFTELRKNKHPNQKLQRAWNKYGNEYFSFNILLKCDKKDLIFYEQRAIDTFNSVDAGYNIRRKAESNFGIVWSNETIQKRADSMRGRKLSPEHCAKIKARKVTDETRKKMSIAALNMTELHKQNISKSSKGKKLSKESRAKISAAIKGKKISEETKIKIKKTKIKNGTLTAGVNHPNRLASLKTAEYKNKMSIAIKNMWAIRKGIKV